MTPWAEVVCASCQSTLGVKGTDRLVSGNTRRLRGGAETMPGSEDRCLKRPLTRMEAVHVHPNIRSARLDVPAYTSQTASSIAVASPTKGPFQHIPLILLHTGHHVSRGTNLPDVFKPVRQTAANQSWMQRPSTLAVA